ncbi:MAG TPA: carboxypeptidase regulatory-like domain-containing protein, partial [Gemmatimonadaceae bacterium]|nr:carboxypeptidase regulatory-like domain-containing protein [Gemmatimonadaceae bacterium]
MTAKLLPTARTLRRAIGLTLLAAGSALAQTTGVIRGRVTDAAARPIPDVAITLSGSPVGAMTNANGEYSLANVPVGSRTVTARRLGYARGSRAVEVTAGAEARADIQLAQVATKLEEFVVTGTTGTAERRTIGNSITKVDVSELNEKTSLAN